MAEEIIEALNDALKKVKKVSDEKRYWFLRTYSGEAYEEYLNNGYVGLGVNNIPIKLIQDVNREDDVKLNSLRKFIEKNTKYKNRSATKMANQQVAFVNEVKEGDTVIIPTKGSSSLTFGIVTSEVYQVTEPGYVIVRDGQEELPQKRRKIKWVKTVAREDLLGDLRGLLSSQQGITNADIFKEFIEGALESVFIQEDQLHMVIQLRQEEDINAFDLQRFLDGLTYFYKEFCDAEGIEPNEGLFIKIKLQSKGTARLKTIALAAGIALVTMIALSDNNEVEFEVGVLHTKGKSTGLMQSVSHFLDANEERRERRKLFDDSLQKLKATELPISNETDSIPKTLNIKVDDSALKVEKNTSKQVEEKRK